MCTRRIRLRYAIMQSLMQETGETDLIDSMTVTHLDGRPLMYEIMLMQTTAKPIMNTSMSNGSSDLLRMIGSRGACDGGVRTIGAGLLHGRLRCLRDFARSTSNGVRWHVQ